MIKTYLGKKGYSIYKKNLTDKDKQEIYNELMMSPYIPNNIVKKTNKFPIYRESSDKLYVPRYYGINKYNEPQEIKLKPPKYINLNFNGNLRDYQENIVETYIKHIRSLPNQQGGGLLEIPCGRGKTVMALKILSILKLKTLIIVHKSFLADQWIERIQQFLPMANIGRIQGQIIDIEDKDIVIGMLQSLSMKSYPESIFSEFGLLICDEVHHIAAEVFVRSLFQIVTKYTLGLSATMQRKDGLSKVFKMFLGDVIYKETPKLNQSVNVYIYNYKVEDDEFNETVYDFKGNAAYSTMMSKLCEYDKRTDYIIDIIKRLLIEDDKQQIIILGHYKNVLNYLYNTIKKINIASVGYYIGGMKQNALKESETKQIIVATYSMASEALDIKTLTTLIMATPKTDITQSIGRILRADHAMPRVIDVVDSHELFKRQGVKRMKYYKAQKYKVFEYNDEIDNYREIDYGKKQEKKSKCMINI